jgi:NAD(P)-dependent dehydrogenase (short-subunit alcohol dehydrogenase family)
MQGMNVSLEGTVAAVTGSGQGLGRGIALRLGSEGAAVAVLDIDGESAKATAEDIRKQGGKAFGLTMDVSKVSEIQPALDRVVEEFGALDLWVNNVGVLQTKAMLELTEEDWDRVVGTNAKGTFFCMQAAARWMAKQGKGVIVNITSGQRARPMATHYASSKMAVDSMTKCAALALAPHKVRVNAIDPGLVLDTPMLRKMDDDRARTLGLKPGEATQKWIESIPLGRMGTLDEIAALVVFLACKDAAFITGQIIAVTGGSDLATAEKALKAGAKA